MVDFVLRHAELGLRDVAVQFDDELAFGCVLLLQRAQRVARELRAEHDDLEVHVASQPLRLERLLEERIDVRGQDLADVPGLDDASEVLVEGRDRDAAVNRLQQAESLDRAQFPEAPGELRSYRSRVWPRDRFLTRD